jgi:hypothetical protein
MNFLSFKKSLFTLPWISWLQEIGLLFIAFLLTFSFTFGLPQDAATGKAFLLVAIFFVVAKFLIEKLLYELYLKSLQITTTGFPIVLNSLLLLGASFLFPLLKMKSEWNTLVFCFLYQLIMFLLKVFFVWRMVPPIHEWKKRATGSGKPRMKKARAKVLTLKNPK